MVVVTSRDVFERDMLADGLREAGLHAKAVAPLTVGAGEADLYDHVWEHAPEVLVVLDRDEATDGELLDQALRAASAPSRPLLVWMTSGDPRGEGLQPLRRSGSPYVVLRVGAVLGRSGLPALSPKMLVPPGLPFPALGLTPLPSLVVEVAGTLTRDDMVGRTMDLRLVPHDDGGSAAWCRVLEAFGTKAEVATGPRAFWSRLIGQPVFRVELSRRGEVRPAA